MTVKLLPKDKDKPQTAEVYRIDGEKLLPTGEVIEVIPMSKTQGFVYVEKIQERFVVVMEPC